MKRIFSLVCAGIVATNAHLAMAQGRAVTLREAIDLAISSSPSIEQAVASVDAAHARIGQIEAASKLHLDGSASYTRIDPTISVEFPVNGEVKEFSFSPNDNYQASVNLQQSLFDFGRQSSLLRVAESSEQAAKDNIDQAKSAIAYQTVQVYYGLLSIDENLAIKREQMKVLQSSLGITEERVKAGTATTLDPLTTQVRMSTIQSDIAGLEASRAKQEAALRRLTGLPTGTKLSVTAPGSAATLPASLDSLTSLAAFHRAELRAAKDAQATAQLQIEAMKHSDDPSLTASITAGIKDGFPPDLTDPVPNWAGTVALHVPILDGGKTKSQVEEAEANLRVANARVADVERGIRSDIEQAIADLAANRTRQTLILEQMQQAREAYDIAAARYKNGAATALDLLNAQSSLEQVDIQRANLALMSELSQYDLARAVGLTIW